MTDSDKYRANARYCLREADKAAHPNDKQSWIDMAETWLGMIPPAQRTPEETNEHAVRHQSTQHGSSKTRH